ncbi:MAG: PAS domain S-box protein [Blastocatellia bacterium]|nr:PAS domain S-box protein [Blastocatellia bacterium]
MAYTQPGTVQFTTRTMLLLFAAVLALIAGVFNLRDRIVQKPVPTDGVVWVDKPGLGVVAEIVTPNSPADLAGIYQGDVLIGINASGDYQEDPEEITEARYVQLILDQVKDHVNDAHPLSYYIVRKNQTGEVTIKEGIADIDRLQSRPTHLTRGIYLALIGLIYLGIGIYVLLLQGRAPYVRHFFVVCLLAFIAHFYSPTEEMRASFDKFIDLADTFALILLGPAFVHFAAIYPKRTHLFQERRWLAFLLYVPSVLLISVEMWLHVEKIRNLIPHSAISLSNLKSLLERGEALTFAAAMLVSCGLMIRTFRSARSTTIRQQLKWVLWGLGIAAVSFTAFYVPSLIANRIDNSSATSLFQSLAIAPLILIPITLGYSIVRYRLMDVDVVMRRSAAYLVTYLAIALLFGSVTAGIYEFLRPQLPPEATLLIAAILMSVIAMLFTPVKNWMQERVDRMFYGEKYDYRMTLQDFGRTLSSTTDLDELLDTLVQRLKAVLTVQRLAIFVAAPGSATGFKIVRAEGIDREHHLPADVAERVQITSDIIRAAELEADGEEAEETVRRRFYYYVPCAARSRVVAVMALGRTVDGALLSSEDLDLLHAISGYVAVAIENAMLLEERERRADELAQLKDFNENIIESINVGVMTVNLQGRITNWNGALEELYGLPREQAIGKRIPEVFRPSIVNALRQYTDRSEVDEPITVYKFRTQALDERELTLNISLAPLHNKTGEVEGTLIAIEDVTARIDLEQQLQQTEKLSSIGLLAAGVAHEVNTPLTGISSYAQMLLQQVPENDPRHQLLQKIHRQTSRASSIVNNLLNFARVSDLRFTEIDLPRVLDDTLQLLEAQLRNTNIEVVRRYTDYLPPALGNAPKLQQVFMNLILNARDAMPHGGQLEISVSADDHAAVVTFRDNGVGISSKNLSKIYDPFFTTKQIGQGTGLGLAVSFGIVQDHGGHIHVESQPGQGTAFYLSIPLASARQQLATASD